MSRTNIPNYTEEELIAALQNGDRYSFEKLYDRFAAVLYGSILKWIKDAQVAENLLQDVFVKAWSNRHSYDAEKGRLFTWLYNIARNVCIDYYRSRQFKKGRTAMLSEDISALFPHSKLVNQMPDTIGVRKLLNRLRYEEKQVVELMYFKGLTQKEIAGLMNMPLGTVKTRMSMAIKNLRQFFISDWKNAGEKPAFNN